MCRKDDWPPFDPRVSDGCTGVLDLGCRECCEKHDERYWKGATEEEREAADLKLRECIQAKGGPFYWALGWIRYAGVRVLPAAKRAFYNKPHKRGA